MFMVIDCSGGHQNVYPVISAKDILAYVEYGYQAKFKNWLATAHDYAHFNGGNPATVIIKLPIDAVKYFL